MTRYLLNIYQPEGDPPPAEVLDRVMKDLESLNAEMRQAGVWVFAGGLTPPRMATVLRDYDGDVTATDGPFAEAKEHIGGLTVIQCAEPEEAVEWGRRLAGIVGLPVEIRPFTD